MYVSQYGKAAGLAERLEKFAEVLSQDCKYPWQGTGLIDDLRCAAALISGQPIPPTMDEELTGAQMEWDL